MDRREEVKRGEIDMIEGFEHEARGIDAVRRGQEVVVGLRWGLKVTVGE